MHKSEENPGRENDTLEIKLRETALDIAIKIDQHEWQPRVFYYHTAKLDVLRLAELGKQICETETVLDDKLKQRVEEVTLRVFNKFKTRDKISGETLQDICALSDGLYTPITTQHADHLYKSALRRR